jgi:formylglycine-generating enzyme required for sulfatase activity
MSRPTKEPEGAGPSLGDIWPCPVDEMVMIYAPADEFEMGSDASDSDADDAKFPQHSVTLDGFWIDQTEVTNVQYRRCVEAGACQAPTCEWGWSTYEHAEHANHPVLCVDWYGAAAYCEWTGARLPTEAEWEYAARGPDSFIYPWGNSPPDSTLLNYAGNVGDTTEVGSYPGGASWCQALDMAGNVWEWVADWYGNHPSEPQTNPTVQPAGKDKLWRGGSYSDAHRTFRTTHRCANAPDVRIPAVGFRCAGQPGG